MRVLVNMLTSTPDRLTGISVYAWSQLRALIARGDARYVLLTNWSRAAVGEHIPLDAVEYIHQSAPQSEKLAFVVNAWHVWRTARRVKADIVFTPHPLGALAGGRARVLVVHDLYRDTHPHLFRADRLWTWKLAFPVALAASKRIVCVSGATRGELAARYPSAAARADVIHEASTLRAEAAPAPLRTGAYALLVANSAPTKNLDTLTDALALLEGEDGVPPVIWVGRDDSGDLGRALARHKPLTNFIEAGPQSEADLATLYRHAAFLVVPSLSEGFCLPVVEAQSFGVPLACSDIPVLREVAGKGAEFFDPRDAKSMAAAIRALGTDAALRADLAEKAAENAGRFSWGRAAAELRRLFDTALMDRGVTSARDAGTAVSKGPAGC